MKLTRKALIKFLNKVCIYLIALAFPLLGYSSVTEIELIERLISSEAPLLAVGAISNIDLETSLVEVNGQKFAFDSITESISGSSNNPIAGSAGLASLARGDYIAITGETMYPGHSLATKVVKLDEPYIAGTSPAFVRVEIGDVLKETAQAASGTWVIDYAAALHDNSLADLRSGLIAEFKGTAYNEAFYATKGHVLENEGKLRQAQAASDVRAGRGSGIRAGRGSGIRAGRDSGIRAGRGSGIRAGRGSGIRAGRGSGIRAGRGSGIRAGRGSGIRAGRGSGIRAGRGSGIRAGRGSGIR